MREIDAGEFVLKLRGRIDGLMHQDDVLLIEEIKTVRHLTDEKEVDRELERHVLLVRELASLDDAALEVPLCRALRDGDVDAHDDTKRHPRF